MAEGDGGHVDAGLIGDWRQLSAAFLCMLEGRTHPPSTALASLVEEDNHSDWSTAYSQLIQYYISDQAHGILQKHINAMYPQSWQSYAAMTLSVEDDIHPMEEEEEMRNGDDDAEVGINLLSTTNAVPSTATARRHLVNANVQVTKRSVLRHQRSMFDQHYRQGQYHAMAASRVLELSTPQDALLQPMTTSKARKRKTPTLVAEGSENMLPPHPSTNETRIREALPVCMHAQFMTHPKSLNVNMLYDWVVPNKHTFYMTEKTDGVRLWLLLTRDLNHRPVQALVDRGGRVWRLHAHVMQAPPGLYKDTLLDGELVWRPAAIAVTDDGNTELSSPTVEFVVFDAIAVGGMQVAQMDFVDTRQPIVHAVCASISWRGVALRAKRWRSLADVFSNNSRTEQVNAYDEWMQQTSLAYMQTHHTDGWIIQHRALASIALPPSVSGSGGRNSQVATNLLCLLQNEIYGSPLMHHSEQMRTYTRHVVDVFKFKPVQTLDFWLVLVPSVRTLRTMIRLMSNCDDNGIEEDDSDGGTSSHDMCALLLSQEEYAHWTYDDYFARFQLNYNASTMDVDFIGTLPAIDASSSSSSRECLCGWFPTAQGVERHERRHEWRSCLPISWSSPSEIPIADSNETDHQQRVQAWIHEHFDIQALMARAEVARATQSPADACMPPVLVCGLVEVAVISSLPQLTFQPLRVRTDKPSANGMQTIGNTVADCLSGGLDAHRLFIALS